MNSITPTREADRFIDMNRGRALIHTAHLIEEAWRSFDRARPVQPDVAEAVRALLAMPLPQQGVDAITALDETRDILDQSISQPRPRYFAFVGSSGLEMGVLADALAACHDVNLAVYAGAANMVEQQALGWISELLGFPGRHGAFTSGGMLSNLTALTAARQHALPDSRRDGITARVAVYTSRDAHSSVARAVEVLGFGSGCIRDIPLGPERRMDANALATAVERDVREQIKPVAIVASAGTTLAGAVDPIDEIADVAQRHGVWLHVDGAYGAPAAAVESARPHFAGLERANSLTVDAHKWLFLPKPCGILLVRDRAALTAAFAHDASYIPDEPDFVQPVEWTLEYSRPLRAMKVWLALRAYGADTFRTAIARNLKQAQICAELVRQSPALELMMEPQLSVVLFRHQPSDNLSLDALNKHNRRLARALQADGRIYVAGANMDGQHCLRACFVNYRTRDDDVRVLIEVVEEVGDALTHQPA